MDTLGQRLADIDRRYAEIAQQTNPLARWLIGRRRRGIKRAFATRKASALRRALSL